MTVGLENNCCASASCRRNRSSSPHRDATTTTAINGQPPVPAESSHLEIRDNSHRPKRQGGGLEINSHLRPGLRRSLDHPAPRRGLFSLHSPHWRTRREAVVISTMADSDEEYVGDVTEDEEDLQVTRSDRVRTRKRKQRGGAEWELSRTWETLVEGADGTISSTVEGLLEAGKRKR